MQSNLAVAIVGEAVADPLIVAGSQDKGRPNFARQRKAGEKPDVQDKSIAIVYTFPWIEMAEQTVGGSGRHEHTIFDI